MKHILLFLPLAAVGCSADSAGGVDTGPVEYREPYDCGWEQGDPGDLIATGAAIGDVIADWSAPDQCNEPYSIWDGAGNYTLLVSVAFW